MLSSSPSRRGIGRQPGPVIACIGSSKQQTGADLTFHRQRVVLISRQVIPVGCDPGRTPAIGHAGAYAWRKLDRRLGEASVPIESGREAIGDVRNGWVGGEAEFGRA